VTDTAFECRNCHATRSVVRYEFSGTDKVIRECSACKLMVLDPLPTEEELKAVYNDGYFDNAALTDVDVTKVYGYVDYIAERIHKQRGYSDICGRLDRFVMKPRDRSARLLDYGCGLGFFLDSAFDRGFDVHGLEFNQYAIDYIRKRYAYPVTHSSHFEPTTRYEVVTMFDVVEHLQDPFGALEEVRDIIAENGILVVSTIDSTSVTSRLMGKRLEDFRRISEHLFFFNRSNLTALLRRLGFDVLATSSLGHSFEIRLLAVRLQSVLPWIGTPMVWLLKLVPFLGGWSIYLNPRTKFIAYARKRATGRKVGLRSSLVTIVVPVGDNADAAETQLKTLLSTDVGAKTELVVAAHGGGDSAEIVAGRLERLGDVRLVKAPGGEGAAVAAGLAASRGGYVVLQTADDGYEPNELRGLLEMMAETGALAVYGSRYSGRFRRTGPQLRTLASKLFTFAANLVNNLNLSDVMVGCKAFDGNLARSLTLRSSGIEYEAELTCRLRQKAVAIYEAPVSYDAGARPGGRAARVRDAWRTLGALVRYGLFRTE
jgi:2-polyprenyl-3-methyl-5-hydroxy-6-metoxy-1,4-benzoquinol methylase